MDSKFQVQAPVEINGFILMGELGRGSTGCVRVARNSETTVDYCVKIVPKQFVTLPEDKLFFDRECSILKTVTHPNIVEFIDLCEDTNNYYLFMEYCRGTSLQTIIANDGPMFEKQIQSIFRQLLMALNYLHSKKIAHRDIKPDNIIINSQNILKLVDFGLCTDNSDALRETFCGSPAYAAPECILRKPYDACSSDIWSAGVVLYMMATGSLPWKMNNMNQMVRQIIDGRYPVPNNANLQVQNLIKSMMNIVPSERPSPSMILASKFFKVVTPVVRPRVPNLSNSNKAARSRKSVPISLARNLSFNAAIGEEKMKFAVSPPNTMRRANFQRMKVKKSTSSECVTKSSPTSPSSHNQQQRQHAVVLPPSPPTTPPQRTHSIPI